MKLQSIHVNRGYSPRNDAPLRGEIVFLSEDGDNEMKLKLDEQLSIDIVELCASAIVRAGQEAAKSLTAEGLQVKAIEHDEAEE